MPGVGAYAVLGTDARKRGPFFSRVLLDWIGPSVFKGFLHVMSCCLASAEKSWEQLVDVRSEANLKSISDAIELLGLEDASLVGTPSFKKIAVDGVSVRTGERTTSCVQNLR